MFNRIACALLITMLLVGSTILLPSPALAQSQASTGQIAGVVKDATGAVVGGATVSLVNPATGFKQSLTTSDTGFYRAVLLPPGRYNVTVSAKGFQEGAANNVDVGVGRTLDLNFDLSVSGRAEQVTVTAEMIETTRHEEAAFMGATIVSSLPLNGRRFQDIVNTTPTAQTDPSRGGITMAGQRMVNTGSINVDGTDFGQLFFGGIRGGERAQFAPTIPLDSIQEFQIVRAGYSAEFGRSTGGVITALTKSGTNAYHGSGQYVIRPKEAGRTNEYYKTVQSKLAATCPTCSVDPNPTLMQWGGSVGGPIKKDKLFFFGSYDQQRQRIPHTVVYDKLATYTPTAQTQEATALYHSFEGPFQQTNDAYLFLIKGDYQISNRHRVSVRYNHSNYEGQNANSVGTSLSPTVSSALSNNGDELDKTRTVAGNLSSFFGHFANDLRAQYARETRPRVANAQSPSVGNTVGYYGTVSYLGQNNEYDYRIQFADSLTWMKGNHTFKFGGEYNRIFANQTFGFNQYGQFSWSTSTLDTVLATMGKCGDATCTTAANRFDNTTISYLHQLGNLQATMKGNQFAAFVQDSWRLRPNFTLNYGLRWEGVTNPTPDANNAMVPMVKGFVFPTGISEDPSVIPNQLTQFAPRLGFAWDPKGNGKTVIRGFGGIYFAATPMLLYASPVNNFREPPGDLSIKLPITVPTAFASLIPGCPSPCNTVYKQLLIAGIDLNNYSLDNLPNPTIDQMKQIAGAILTAQGLPFNPYNGAGPLFTDNNYSNPRSYQAGFGIEREVTPGWTVALEGTWIKTVHLERDTDLNMPFSPCVDAAGRPLYRLTGSAPTGNNCPTSLQSSSQLLVRPVPGLAMIQIRDASAKGLYRAMTLRTNVNRKWGQINAYYTMAENLDNDYNERQAGGVFYQDRYNWAPDYSYSDINRRHQFVAQPVFFLHWGFDLSSAIRYVSGAPIDPRVGSDFNQDTTNNDRPYWGVGVPALRNSFTNLGTTYIDLGLSKRIKLTESKQLKFSTQLFNLFNLMNLSYASSTATNYCQALPKGVGALVPGVDLNPTNSSTINATCGIPSFLNLTQANNGWTYNRNFLQLRNNGLLTTNSTNIGYSPFEAQFSVSFTF